MTTTPTERSAKLSDAVAEEIRAVMGRRRVSGAELARRLNVSPMWVSYRLAGRQEIGLNDLQAIAGALEVEVSDLLPTGARSQTTGRSVVPADRPRDNRPKSRPTGRPGTGVDAPGVRRPKRIANPPFTTALLSAA